jgi:hypothetical protein
MNTSGRDNTNWGCFGPNFGRGVAYTASLPTLIGGFDASQSIPIKPSGLYIEHVLCVSVRGCFTVLPTKPLFYRESGFSGQRVASRCGNQPLRPGSQFHSLLLKNGGYKYVGKGLQGVLGRLERGQGCV